MIYPENAENQRNKFRCGIKKDAGDDADVTDGCEIFALAELFPSKESGVTVEIDGGEGVGRVTKDGLDQKKGNAAINSVPRKMIFQAVMEECEKYGFSGRVSIIIDIPSGAEIAKRTFNANLGITGGLSVIGTSGVVEPMSEQALLGAIEAEINVIAAENRGRKSRAVIVTPGEYGISFINQFFDSEKNPRIPIIKCSNFIGNTLDFLAAKDFTHVLIAGHAGKFVKLAGGIFNTHSRTADCHLELLACHASLSGANRATIAAIMDSATVDAALCVLDLAEEVRTDDVLKSILKKIEAHLNRRISGAFKWAFLMFTNERGIIAKSENLLDFVHEMQG